MTTIKKKHNLFMAAYILFLLFISMAAFNCSHSDNKQNVRKIELPEATYRMSPDSFPFRFEISDQAELSVRKNKDGEYFCDVVYPELNAQIYCTWHEIIPEKFNQMTEESRRMVYSHTNVAMAIREQFYSNDFIRVYGILYDIKGPVATPVQIALTDSTSYFFNASLYFNSAPNTDSIAPYLDYVRKDIVRMMESFTPVNH